MTDTEANDYSTEMPRPHHNLYIEDGNLVLHVENAIFKVHRSILTKCSPVIKDMLDVPTNNNGNVGTDENPLLLTEGTASSWELLLQSIYDSPQFWVNDELLNGRLLGILPVAHEYRMEGIEGAALKQLKNASTTTGYVDLMVASQIVNSKLLYNEALKHLQNAKNDKPNLAQAERIGLASYFAVMDGRNIRCRYCSELCACIAPSCGRYQ